MRSGMFSHTHNPYHMADSGSEKGIWLHRIIPGLRHTPEPECVCDPRKFTEDEIDDEGYLPPLAVAHFNMRH